MTNKVDCGGVIIGGGAKISIQSMTNVDTKDVKACLEQINRLAAVSYTHLTLPTIYSV